MFRDHPLFCFWLSYVPIVIITKAEAAEALISGTKHLQKNWSYNFLHPWLGTGLLTSHGSKWKSRRKLLTNAFHFDILKDFLPVFNEQSQILAKRLKNEITKDFTNILKPVTLCTLDIICETTFGVKIGAQENEESQYLKSVTRAEEIIIERIANFWHWSDFFYQFTESGKELKKHLNVLHKFTRSVIQKKKNKLLFDSPDPNQKRKRMALMDLLLEHHIQTKDLTEEDIREEADTFAFEGHDTTSMAVCWALYLIGLHKDVQDKIHEELDQIFGDDLERHVTMDDLKDMTYLDRVFKESQRIYPSVPIVARRVSEDTTICGYRIPKGSSCAVAIYQVHRDERMYPNPEKFDPDRFLPEKTASRHPYAFIPFSAGPRNCIGQRFASMEEKIVVATILRYYTVKSLDQREKFSVVAELVLRPSIPLRIQIRPRKKDQ
ncbi:Cytochrome P450 4c3 like protein [Argiope bruennichi]|uniref:Cytochrome P450 4c3 like protein n=2 Tax=Argiope bruennichi TaxID=94029 RepID=A0A8T0F454_ARGBR|nr:Cytochrome P450 4c3 like protein [Argiope bruennichi]